MSSDDPWSWTVEDTVTRLCRSRELFIAAGHGSTTVPEPSMLEQFLRRHQMTGAMLLSRVDVNALRNDFHSQGSVASSALLAVIDYLRSSSATHNHRVATAGLRALDIDQRHPAPLSPVSTPGEMAATNASVPKKRKANLTTIPLQSRPRQFQDTATPVAHTAEMAKKVTDSTGGWEYLSHWAQDNEDTDEVIDMSDGMEEDGSSEEVFEDDEPDALHPMEAITPPIEPQAGRLSSEEVVEVINERITFYTDHWRPGKGEEGMADPLKLWEDAEASGRRPQLVETYRNSIEWYEHRLNKLGDKIMETPWNSLKDLRHVCGTLEGTVDLLENAKWLLSIYDLPSEAEPEQHSPDRPDPALNGAPEIIDLDSDAGSSSQSELEDHEQDMLDQELMAVTAMPRTVTTANESPHSAVMPRIEPDNRGHSPITGRVPLGDSPEIASINTVSRWNWGELIEKADRKRIVMKAMYEMCAESREAIRRRLRAVRKQNLFREISTCINMLLRGEQKIMGVLPRDLPKIVTFTKLFLCWWLAGDYFSKEAEEIHLAELVTNGETGDDLETFYNWVCHILENTFSEEALKQPHAPLQAEIIVISDDEDAPLARPVSQKRRPGEADWFAKHRETVYLD